MKKHWLDRHRVPLGWRDCQELSQKDTTDRQKTLLKAYSSAFISKGQVPSNEGQSLEGRIVGSYSTSSFYTIHSAHFSVSNWNLKILSSKVSFWDCVSLQLATVVVWKQNDACRLLCLNIQVRAGGNAFRNSRTFEHGFWDWTSGL